MKVRFKRTTWRAFGAIVASGILVVSFQNCGKAGFDSSLDGELSSAAVDAALAAKYGANVGAKVSAIPFSFDGGFDQITYNSCSESTLSGNTAAFFSIKAGAYETMGIKLSDDFFNYVNTNNGFSANYPETVLSKGQYAGFLADSPANKGAVANAAIRSRSNLFNVYSSSTTVTLGTDVVGMAGNLTDSLVMDGLTTQTSAYTHYFPFSQDSRNVEATFYFNKDQGVAEGFRKVLIGDGVLSFTYLSSSSDPNLIRAPSSTAPAKAAYGKGYSMVFSKAGSYINEPANVLTQLQENDLKGSSSSVAWTCARKYQVVRVADRATYCPAITDADLASANGPYIRRELDIARRHMRADQWDINPLLRCMVPKDNISCYNEELINGAAAGVEYDTSAACFNPLVQAGNYATPIPTKRCAAYVSICTRF